MQKFTVYSVGINAGIFAANYGQYIAEINPGYFGGVEFTMFAPASIRAEIADLAGNCIEIID